MGRTISQVAAVCLIVVLTAQPAIPPPIPCRQTFPKNSVLDLEALALRPGTITSALTLTASVCIFGLAAAAAGRWILHSHFSAVHPSLQTWMLVASGVGILMANVKGPPRSPFGLRQVHGGEPPIYRGDYGIIDVSNAIPPEGTDLLTFLKYATASQLAMAIMAASPELFRQLPDSDPLLIKIVKLLEKNRPGPQETLQHVGSRMMRMVWELLQIAETQGLGFVAAPLLTGVIVQPTIEVAGPEIFDRLPRSPVAVQGLVKNPLTIPKKVGLLARPIPKLPLAIGQDRPLFFTPKSVLPTATEDLMLFIRDGDPIDFANALINADPTLSLPLLGSEELLIETVTGLVRDRPGTLDDGLWRTNRFFQLLLDAYRQGLAVITPPAVRLAVTEKLRTISAMLKLANELWQISHFSISEATAASIAAAIMTQRRGLIERTFLRWGSVGEDPGIAFWIFDPKFNQDVMPEEWLRLVNLLYAEARRISQVSSGSGTDLRRNLGRPA